MNPRAAFILVPAGFSGLALLAVSIFDTSPRLLYNASPSAPTGFYDVERFAALKVGDLVATRVPIPMRSLVVERGYLASNVPVVKRIVAIEGDHVCFRDGAVYLNSNYLVEPLAADSLQRPMPVWRGCGALKEDEFFLAMSDVPASLDSRYFGPVSRSDILGRVRPIVLRGSGSSPEVPDVQGGGCGAQRQPRPEGKIKATAPWDG